MNIKIIYLKIGNIYFKISSLHKSLKIKIKLYFNNNIHLTIMNKTIDMIYTLLI